MRPTRAVPFAPAVLALILAATPWMAQAGVTEPRVHHEAKAEAPHRHAPPRYHERSKEAAQKPHEPAAASTRAAAESKAATAAEPAGKPVKTAAKSAKKYEPPDPRKGTATGLPLPRFAALRSDDVNLRIGPGTRYPIEWVYKRRELPVEIEREFEVWRLVQDPEGAKGWVHQATLTGRRSFVVVGAERTLRERPADDAYPVARLKPGVVGRILHCDAGSAWCRVQAGDYRGWLKRSEFWGTLEGEAIN
jgi:SH3-like domain-containing protein